ncbi:FAD:protein FMN transferase [Bradyrhizobium sp. Leo121]|uniref:FAD:protein FMN transferase n=1 Tax=Bradyrhizobium sp. Leo121 TaxID=1571195 RepID=UPI00102A3190|nr:FAD:protein FMN transferase [Bradyrhizobium sp. Leo121]RZN35195.1 thiamine biosynthesis protein ApbE [Bradyrhizobium sp. Leo121]
MPEMLSRRRFIRISAAAAGLSLVPFRRGAKADTNLVTWRGTMLGAIATLKIHHEHPREAERLIAVACSEARRLERLFSLYRDDSALVELNRTGVLVDPPAELVDLLEISLRYAELTNGAFDPTVQPLWRLYADHFSRVHADRNGPAPADVQLALANVGYRRLHVSRDRIAMPRGAAITLNGIAQGYVTDRIVDLLRAQGIARSLVDMGESRAIGPRPDGQPWEIGIADSDSVGVTATVIPIVDRAVSTSGSYGFCFDADGRFNHLFDPSSGGCAGRYRSVTTIAADATAADAMSTAFSLMTEPRIRSLLMPARIERVHLIDARGYASDLVA